VQQEQIDGGGDAAAAVSDHLPVFDDALRYKFAFGLGRRDQFFGRLQQRRRGNIDAARNASRPPMISNITAPARLQQSRQSAAENSKDPTLDSKDPSFGFKLD
jgi:hypothetical protein